MTYKLELHFSHGSLGKIETVTTGWVEADDDAALKHLEYINGFNAPVSTNIYRTKLKWGPWRYGEKKIRPAAILSARNVSNFYYPYGSKARRQKIEQLGFVCEQLMSDGSWVDVTAVFL